MLPHAVSIGRGSGVGARTSARPIHASARSAPYGTSCQCTRDQDHDRSGPTAAMHRARDAQSAPHGYRARGCAPGGMAQTYAGGSSALARSAEGGPCPSPSHRRALLSSPRRHARPRPARRPRSRCKSSIRILPQALSAGGGLKHPPAPPSGMGLACGAHQVAAARLVSARAEATVTPRRAVPAARTAHRAHVSRGRTYTPTTRMRGEPRAAAPHSHCSHPHGAVHTRPSDISLP